MNYQFLTSKQSFLIQSVWAKLFTSILTICLSKIVHCHLSVCNWSCYYYSPDWWYDQACQGWRAGRIVCLVEFCRVLTSHFLCKGGRLKPVLVSIWRGRHIYCPWWENDVLEGECFIFLSKSSFYFFTSLQLIFCSRARTFCFGWQLKTGSVCVMHWLVAWCTCLSKAVFGLWNFDVSLIAISF